jgi:heme-degrading monooxygenase HmoA
MMPTFRELDSNVGFQAQLGAATGPIVLANVMNTPPGEIDHLVKVWAADAAFMRAAPGFISTQLHRGVAGSGALLNLAVWESAAHLRAAFFSDEFQRHLAEYPASATVAPHVFEQIAVPGICVA